MPQIKITQESIKIIKKAKKYIIHTNTNTYNTYIRHFENGVAKEKPTRFDATIACKQSSMVN